MKLEIKNYIRSIILEYRIDLESSDLNFLRINLFPGHKDKFVSNQ